MLCRFSGLVKFPFDTLKCPLELGGWMQSSAHQGVQLDGAGFEMAYEVTSAVSYQEHTISNITVDYHTYEYPCCPREPWTAVIYTVSLERAFGYYVYVRALVCRGPLES